MLVPGPAKKVTIHLNQDTVTRNDFLGNDILALLLEHGVAGATVLRPETGFGSHRKLHGLSGGIDADPHMPVRIEFVESPEMVERLLPLVEALLTDGLIEAHDTTILKAAMGSPSVERGGQSI